MSVLCACVRVCARTKCATNDVLFVIHFCARLSFTPLSGRRSLVGVLVRFVYKGLFLKSFIRDDGGGGGRSAERVCTHIY